MGEPQCEQPQYVLQIGTPQSLACIQGTRVRVRHGQAKGIVVALQFLGIGRHFRHLRLLNCWMQHSKASHLLLFPVLVATLAPQTWSSVRSSFPVPAISSTALEEKDLIWAAKGLAEQQLTLL